MPDGDTLFPPDSSIAHAITYKGNDVFIYSYMVLT